MLYLKYTFVIGVKNVLEMYKKYMVLGDFRMMKSYHLYELEGGGICTNEWCRSVELGNDNVYVQIIITGNLNAFVFNLCTNVN